MAIDIGSATLLSGAGASCAPRPVRDDRHLSHANVQGGIQLRLIDASPENSESWPCSWTAVEVHKFMPGSTTQQKVEQAVADEERFCAQYASRDADMAQAHTLLRSNEAAAEAERRTP